VAEDGYPSRCSEERVGQENRHGTTDSKLTPRPCSARLYGHGRLLGGEPGWIPRHVNATSQEQKPPAFDHRVILINDHVLTEDS
jgi:hypothetical protein